MPSTKNKAYDVEKIVSKKSDRQGRTLYLIKWKGFAASDNTWEPEEHLANCQETIEAFEAEHTKKEQARDASSLSRRTSQRPTRSGASPSKNRGSRTTRSSNRSSSTRQQGKRESTSDRSSISDDDEKDYMEKKSSPKRARKSTTDTGTTSSIGGDDSDVLDTAKLDQILDVRRNKKTDEVEYNIQAKKMKKSVWVSTNQLTEDYSQQVVDFLEEKYV